MRISIPKPCAKDWNEMEERNDGRFCDQCSQVVYDFSFMSDDELLNYFKTSTRIPCGRFHNSQLDRPLTPAIPATRIPFRFNKVAAAALTILSFKSIDSKAQKATVASSIVEQKDQSKISGDNDFKITGTVTNTQGVPLAGAKITFDSIDVATTDSEGKFSISFVDIDMESTGSEYHNGSDFHNLYFSYDSMVTVVRSYHPSMMTTEFNVQLYKQAEPGSRHFSGGAPLFYGDNPIGDLPSITFSKLSSKLSIDSKAMLATVGSKLRANPFACLYITAYVTSHKNFPVKLQNQRVEVIRQYLINQEGIIPERLKSKNEVNGVLNTIDLIGGLKEN